MFTDSYRNAIPELLEYKQDTYSRQDLDDSIIYAKRIQDGMMLKEKHLQRIFPESFIYMRPRNIVSGDFYWFTRIGNKVIIAVADCTGHGIPGALMSILGINLLNQIIIEERNTNPAFILNRLDHKVRKAFSYTSDLIDEANKEYNDGMDIAMCSLDIDNNSMEFAGAYRPVYLVRHKEIMEIKGSRFPIGGNSCEPLFTNVTTKLEKGDKIYLSSDGYASQFGFLTDKKYSSGKIKNLLLNISGNSFTQQKDALENTFTDWKLTQEQTDDVLILGFKT